MDYVLTKKEAQLSQQMLLVNARSHTV